VSQFYLFKLAYPLTTTLSPMVLIFMHCPYPSNGTEGG